MKTNRLCFVVVGGLFPHPIPSPGDQDAHARLFCLSLQFQHASDSTTEYSLDLASGELWPYDPSTYAANVTLNDDWFGSSDPGTILLALPPFTDANGNGYDDFFESVQPLGGTTTSGSYNLGGLGPGALSATWSRPAGSSWGGCVLKFNPSPFYTWLTFNISFQILEYLGPLGYTPGTTSVTGRVDVVQTDATNNVFGGPVDFVKTATNRFNALIFQPGAWTNAAQQTLTYTNSLFTRDPTWPTNYGGYVLFYDVSDPTNPPPYNLWVLSIDDPNDSNHNGIPDFSDDPSPPRRPTLSLARGPTNLWLTVSGDVGHLHQVQEAPSLTPANWTTIWSESLTNDPQTVSIPQPSAAAKFWRALAQ
ncbi:MAG TPA: hypothetical protein VN765_13600 [Candidatus Acidoferrum sp.]|nr:hypothetical protein [Candidatus Acidoferrum sp.]